MAQDPLVALPKISGSSRARPKTLRKYLRRRLLKDQIRVVTRKRLARAARRSGGTQKSVKAAKAARASYLITARVRRSKGKYVVRARLRAVPSGRVLKKVTTRYRSGRSAKKRGAKLGKIFANAIWADVERGQASGAEPIAEAEPAPIAAPAARSDGRPDYADEAPAPEPARETRTTRRPWEPAPKEREPVAAAEPEQAEEKPARRSSRRKKKGPEQASFRFQVGVGSQLYTGYSVMVGSQKTALTHTISPMLLAELGLSFLLSDNFGVDLNASYIPTSFKLNVNPPVTPNEPSGAYINAGGDIFYNLHLGDSLVLAPVLGADMRMLQVDEQAVILGWTEVSAGGGLRLTILGSARLAFILEGQGRYILSYSETPASTGESPSGFSVTGGAGLRFWFTDSIGAYGRLSYSYAKISMSGAGDRTVFQGDPGLNGASVYFGVAQGAVGLSFAL